MSIEAWIASTVVVAVFGVLALGYYPPYVALLGGLTALLAGGIIDADDAFSGFSNSGVITVGVLYVVAAGLKQTGALGSLTSRAMGRPRTVRAAQTRMLVPVTIGSAFLNNTPLVAMLLPVVIDWSRSASIPASKLLLPFAGVHGRDAGRATGAAGRQEHRERRAAAPSGALSDGDSPRSAHHARRRPSRAARDRRSAGLCRGLARWWTFSRFRGWS